MEIVWLGGGLGQSAPEAGSHDTGISYRDRCFAYNSTGSGITITAGCETVQCMADIWCCTEILGHGDVVKGTFV